MQAPIGRHQRGRAPEPLLVMGQRGCQRPVSRYAILEDGVATHDPALDLIEDDRLPKLESVKNRGIYVGDQDKTEADQFQARRLHPHSPIDDRLCWPLGASGPIFSTSRVSGEQRAACLRRMA